MNSGKRDQVTQRTRKFYGALLLLGSLIIYPGIATWIYLSLLMGAHTAVLLIYFAIAGFGWFFPAGMIIKWMAKPDQPDSAG